MKIKVKKADCSEVTVHRDVLGSLLAISHKDKKLVDINKALGSFPCSSVSAPLSTCDGEIRKTNKSALYKCALSELDEIQHDDIPAECDVYLLDLAAYVRTVVSLCKSVRDIADHLLKSIPAQYKTVCIVADNYNDVSIKGGCR